jgi:uncharacterized membrane protein YtjA (UPF0391 family)
MARIAGVEFRDYVMVHATERFYTPSRVADCLLIKKEEEEIVLHYAWVFLVVAIIAAVLGFGVVAGTAAAIAKFCFVAFLVIFIVSFLMGRRSAV